MEHPCVLILFLKRNMLNHIRLIKVAGLRAVCIVTMFVLKIKCLSQELPLLIYLVKIAV